ncbi:isopeptide-forming domain-containing fimbrial protein [Bifidobacterium pseudocatenulatum]|uniref:isopeptide-forming domain-containing fimbrial protein n=1 Tax=Bifidobacterium pseudocatenulatum TaxID=28026 RepID=UPI00080B36AB|nr:isopeptide-forming domain-containing fimbrial protein [Bifidobacterium pseudocatenulatum]MCB4877034.1 isopeptide-forming domain-containing fimbrial protein [Bifidobacterium pseudocatenulatum]
MKTKNLLKATVATLVAGAMGLAGVGSAMAADTRVDESKLGDGAAARQTLTVAANGDISNRTLKAVPLAYYSYAQTDGTNITGFDLIDAGKASAIADALTKANIDTKSKKDQTAGYDYNASNPMVWVVQNLLDSENSPWAGKLRDFIDQLKNEAAVTGDKGTAFAKGADAKHMTASVRPGVYAVVDATKTGQASIVMFNGTGIDGKTTLKNGAKTYTLGTVDYKVHNAEVTKGITVVEDGDTDEKITSRDKEAPQAGEEYAVAKTSIGKKVSFKMTSKVPVWTGYDHYYYALNDTYTNGLTFNADSVNVTVNGKALTADKDYKVTPDGGKFHILFAPTADGSSDIIAAKTTFPVGAEVLVTYTMTVNKNAHVDGVDTNTSEVEYSHNPNTVTDHEKTPGDTTYVYVGKFTLTKTDTNNAPLAGAMFNIKDTKSNIVKFVKVNDNEYRVADSTEAATASADITTTDKNNGVITLKGMYGAYTVTETKSPFDGSILPEFTLTVGVAQSKDHNTSTSSLTAFGQDSNKLASKTSDDGVTVINARNIADMPKTGAVWLSIFGVMTVLLAGASALLLRRKA